MSKFDNTNRGVLFVNDRKVSANQPDRTGSLNVDGKEFFLDGWLKQSKDGKKFLSLSVKAKDSVKGAKAAPAAAPKSPDPDEDIPFN